MRIKVWKNKSGKVLFKESFPEENDNLDLVKPRLIGATTSHEDEDANKLAD